VQLVFEPLCQGILNLVNIAYLDRKLAKFLSKRLLGVASKGLLAQKVTNHIIFQSAGELKERIAPDNEVRLVHDCLDDIEKSLLPVTLSASIILREVWKSSLLSME